MILHLTSDLMATSELKATARSFDTNVVVVSTVEKAIEKLTEKTQLLVIDLQTSRLDLGAFLEQISNAYAGPIIAYAQHVHDELLETAKGLGIKQVLTRGQFSASVAAILERIVSAS